MHAMQDPYQPDADQCFIFVEAGCKEHKKDDIKGQHQFAQRPLGMV